jgi:predicted NBD/HSP70 family sugar kinase
VRRIVSWALAGDPAAQQTIEQTARYLGIGVSNLVWCLDADTVVIDAIIADAWAMIEPAIRQQLPDDSDLWGPRTLQVRPSALGGAAALIGAATLPLGRVFAGASSSELASRDAK